MVNFVLTIAVVYILMVNFPRYLQEAVAISYIVWCLFELRKQKS